MLDQAMHSVELILGERLLGLIYVISSLISVFIFLKRDNDVAKEVGCDSGVAKGERSDSGVAKGQMNMKEFKIVENPLNAIAQK